MITLSMNSLNSLLKAWCRNTALSRPALSFSFELGTIQVNHVIVTDKKKMVLIAGYFTKLNGVDDIPHPPKINAVPKGGGVS